MLEVAYGSAMAVTRTLRAGRNSGSTAALESSEVSLSSLREGLGLDSACKWAQRSPKMASMLSSSMPRRLAMLRSARRPFSGTAELLSALVGDVAGASDGGDWRAGKSGAVAACAMRRRRCSRVTFRISVTRHWPRLMAERARAELFSDAGLHRMSDSTGAWYNLIGARG